MFSEGLPFDTVRQRRNRFLYVTDRLSEGNEGVFT